MEPPTIADVEVVRLEAATNQVLDLLEAGGYSKYSKVIEQILFKSDDATSLDVASVLFKLAFDELDRQYEVSDLDDYSTNYRKEGMVRLFMNAGTMDKIQAKNIVQGIASKSSLPGKLIGAIDIHKQFTFIEVPEEYADQVMESMRDFSYKGRAVSIERAGKRQRLKSNKGRQRGRNRIK